MGRNVETKPVWTAVVGRIRFTETEESRDFQPVLNVTENRRPRNCPVVRVQNVFRQRPLRSRRVHSCRIVRGKDIYLFPCPLFLLSLSLSNQNHSELFTCCGVPALLPGLPYPEPRVWS